MYVCISNNKIYAEVKQPENKALCVTLSILNCKAITTTTANCIGRALFVPAEFRCY